MGEVKKLKLKVNKKKDLGRLYKNTFYELNLMI